MNNIQKNQKKKSNLTNKKSIPKKRCNKIITRSTPTKNNVESDDECFVSDKKEIAALQKLAEQRKQEKQRQKPNIVVHPFLMKLFLVKTNIECAEKYILQQ